MLEGTIRTGIILVWLLIALGSNPSFAQTITVGGAPRPFTDLTLEIFAPNPTVLRLQPIPLVIRQVNRKNGAVLGYQSMPFRSLLALYVRRGTEPDLRIEPLSPISGLVYYTLVELPPGTSADANEWITINLSKYFPNSGSYEVYARLSNTQGTEFVESNRITVQIQEPVGNDRLVYELIRNHRGKDYLFSGAVFRQVKGVLETITTQYPNSAYAKSAFFVLGETHFHRREFASALVNLMRLENDDTFIHYLAEIRAAQAQ